MFCVSACFGINIYDYECLGQIMYAIFSMSGWASIRIYVHIRACLELFGKSYFFSVAHLAGQI